MKKLAAIRRKARTGLAGCFAAAAILTGAVGGAVPAQAQPQPPLSQAPPSQCLAPVVPPSAPSQDPLLAFAQEVLAEESQRIALFLGLPECSVDGIIFVVDDTYGADHRPAETRGNVITLFRQSLEEDPADIRGVIIHELVHAMIRSPAHGGDFSWMSEGIADFVRSALGYGGLVWGDPHESYKKAGSFFYWLYERPDDNHETYFAVVKDFAGGVRPANLDALLKEFNNGAAQLAATKTPLPSASFGPR